EVEEPRQAGDGLQLQLQPEGDRLTAQSVTNLRQRGRRRLQPTGDRIEPVAERREVAREQQEERVTQPFPRRDASFPGPVHLLVEDGAPSVQDRQLMLKDVGL